MGLYIKVKSKGAVWIGDQIKIFNTSEKNVTLLIIAPEELPIKRDQKNASEQVQNKCIGKVEKTSQS